jgi:hypothetical protein
MRLAKASLKTFVEAYKWFSVAASGGDYLDTDRIKAEARYATLVHELRAPLSHVSLH